MQAFTIELSPSAACEAEKHDLPRGDGCGIALFSSRRLRNGSSDDVDEIEDDLDLDVLPAQSENTDSGDDTEDSADRTDDDQGGETFSSLGIEAMLEYG